MEDAIWEIELDVNIWDLICWSYEWKSVEHLVASLIEEENDEEEGSVEIHSFEFIAMKTQNLFTIKAYYSYLTSRSQEPPPRFPYGTLKEKRRPQAPLFPRIMATKVFGRTLFLR